MAPGEAILRQLISEYGAALHLPTGDNLIAAHIANETRLAKGTLLSILKGSTGRINENTRAKLAEFFNRAAIPQIQAIWLSSGSLAEFNSKRAYSASIPLAMPVDYHQKVATIEHWLCGVHIVYRYSLDFIDTGDVAREVIHIWNNGKFIEFKMSFINPSGRNRGPIFYFEGPVLLVGRSVILFGTNIGSYMADREYDRIRVIVIDHDNAGGDTHDCKLGLMTSTRPRRDHAPCTASTILIRTQWAASKSTLSDLVETATVIRSLEETIEEDFGTANGRFIERFLDNRPYGYNLDAEMDEYVSSLGRGPERVLRLDTERFASNMRHILAKIISSDDLCAPFKQNWLSHMHREKN